MKEINELKVRKPQAYLGINEPLVRKQPVRRNLGRLKNDVI